MKIAQTLLLALAFFAAVSYAGIIELNDNNYEGYLKSYPTVLLKLYSPHCSHCKQFAPLYEEVARTIKAQGKDYLFAQIDCYENRKAADYFHVTSYPMVKLWLNGTVIDFKEERSLAKLLNFLHKHLGHGIENLKTIEAVNRVKKTNILRSFLITDDLEMVSSYKEASLEEPQYMYYYLSAELGKKAFPNAPAAPIIVALNGFEEEEAYYKPRFDKADLEEFLLANEYPAMLTEFTQEIIDKVFHMPTSTHKGVILFRDVLSLDADKLDREFRAVARKQKEDKLVFAVSDIKGEGMQSKIAFFLSLQEKDLPILQIISMDGEMKRYVYKGPMTEAKMAEFVETWKDGRAERFYRSEPIPVENKGPVYKIVGKNFKQEVLENGVDVVVNFCASWNTACKEFSKLYEKVAQKLAGNKMLKMVEIDITANDVDGHPPKTFPRVMLFPGKEKSAAEEILKRKTEEDIISFLKRRCSFPVEEST